MPTAPPMELISTIRPLPCWRISGRTCCTTRTQPQKFVSSRALASLTVVCSTAPATPQPAAATSASIRPCAVVTACTPARTEASSSTSMTRPCQPPGAVPRLLAPATVQPVRCSRCAQASPRPAEAPVISTTRGVPVVIAVLSSPAGSAGLSRGRLAWLAVARPARGRAGLCRGRPLAWPAAGLPQRPARRARHCSCRPVPEIVRRLRPRFVPSAGNVCGAAGGPGRQRWLHSFPCSNRRPSLTS